MQAYSNILVQYMCIFNIVFKVECICVCKMHVFVVLAKMYVILNVCCSLLLGVKAT